MFAITPLLAANGETPLYVQLYAYIKEQIETGAIPSGARLPSIRQLAKHLEVSKNTVDSAYAQLLAEGYIESRERRGCIVLPLDDMLPHGDEKRVRPGQKARGASPAPASAGPGVQASSGHADEAPPASGSKPRFDFQYGDIAYDRFPMDRWRSSMMKALASPPQELLGYGDPLGLPELRKEISDFAYQSRGAVCAPEQVVICAGTQHAVGLLCQLMQLHAKEIGMEEPGYDGVKTVFLRYGCNVSPIAVDEDGIRPDLLAKTDPDLVYVTPSHQFPLGMVMPIQRRTMLLNWASRSGSWIIEDDYDSEFRYDSRPIPSLKALDAEGRVIYLGTMSKCFMPALRLSYMILPAPLMESASFMLAGYSQTVSPIIQRAAAVYMRDGHWARHIRRMKRIYQSRHRALTTAVKRHMGDRAELIGDRSGLHVLLDVKGRHRDELARLAELADCRIYSPAKHWNDPDRCPDSYIMLGFGGLTEEELEEGIRRLAAAWFGD